MMLLLLFALVSFTLADIPVHCEYPQVAGTWSFSLTEKIYSRDEALAKCPMESNPSTTLTKTFTLAAPDLATDEDGYVGTWTMVFDQGLEISIAGEKYFAFFKFSRDGSNFTSICTATWTGTYHRDVIAASHWGCLFGKQTSSLASASYPRSYSMDDLLPHHGPSVFQNDEDLVRRVNAPSSGSLWTARTYPELEGKPFSTGKLMSPLRLSAWQSHSSHVSKLSSTRPKPSSSDYLPEAFDWRNVSGVNYVSPVRAQLMCGSCYAFSVMAQLEAHQRIQTNNAFQPVYSPQDVLDCCHYSQGCDGGMPLLVSKYGQDFGVAQEQCDPYKGEAQLQCVDGTCPLDRTYVYHYQYVGGYYGAANEDNMMRAIYERGPVSIAFEVYPDLKQYHSGIYHHSTTSNSAPTPKFYAANHAVLIVGWGVQDGTKYWIVKNSWGTAWGNQGYFWILKGSNECSVESLAVTTEPVSPGMV